MVVIEIHAVAIAVEILPILLAIHEDLHGFAALFEDSDNQDHTDRKENLDNMAADGDPVVKPALGHLHQGHGLEAILSVEMPLWVNGRIMNAADHPGRAVERTADRILQAHYRVRTAHETMWSHGLLTREREVVIDWSN